LAAKNQKTYRQVVLVGDDHRYHNDDERLIKRIYSWLYRTVPEGLIDVIGQATQAGDSFF
jgi:hypothetical protein